ncbi:MAG: M28 family peptidase [Candidatus Eisenbacteria bacterium]|nr:M28 family peptidase [Candidatus Eisenbacteria bacterium]
MRPGALFSSVLCSLWMAANPAAGEEAPSGGPPPLAGYSAAASRAERAWEERFRAIPSADSVREHVRALSARPHPVGSEAGKRNAEWMRDRLRAWGLEAQIETFYVLFPTPRDRSLELLEPSAFTCRLREPAVPGDPSSAQQDEQLPTYNAFSCDGDVTAPLVYVNYGIPSDYEQLERLGVDVKGCIVIARYGACFRGVKPRVAAEHGAVGCIIYSDPRDDGYYQGETYPAGPFRPADGVQRGSAIDQSTYPGDPLTPGYAAAFGAKRLALADAKSITRVPVLPISYGDAQPLLAALAGPVAPDAWRGALPITYRLGPGPAKVRLKVSSNWDLKPIHDVVARIPGAAADDEWVIRGNHHDAWVNGTQDPVSGVAAVLEEGRAFGQLLRAGWKPRRTIFLCAWDGEEPGLMGSTEWAEAHADELRRHAVLYINSDSNGRGFLDVDGSQPLEAFVNEVARDVPDPETRLSTWERRWLREIGTVAGADERKELRAARAWRLGPLGSGSDYTAFLDHLGVASLNMGFGGEDRGGVYHSIYDDFSWYTRFADGDFRYGRALAQTAGSAVMRFAGAELLPLGFTPLAAATRRFEDEVEKLLKKAREDAVEHNQRLGEGYFAAVADPKVPLPAPVPMEVPPELDFQPLRSAVDSIAACATRYDSARVRAAVRGGEALARVSLATVNQALMETERRLTLPEGLPGRPWYRHMVYAPGQYTGYGAKTFPGVREAIELKRWDEARTEIVRLAGVLKAEAALIDSAARELSQAGP